MKKDCEDYTTFASTVNKYCERFQLNEITPDMFKCLIFLQGLTSMTEKEVHTRLLTKLEQDQKITLQSLAEECQHILNLRTDTAKIKERDVSNIHTIKNKPQGKKNKPFFKINPCYRRGKLHLSKDCPFKHKKCHTCGHKEHKFSHSRLGGGNYSKNKKQLQYTTEQATTEKIQRKYINICLNNKK